MVDITAALPHSPSQPAVSSRGCSRHGEEGAVNDRRRHVLPLEPVAMVGRLGTREVLQNALEDLADGSPVNAAVGSVPAATPLGAVRSVSLAPPNFAERPPVPYSIGAAPPPPLPHRQGAGLPVVRALASPNVQARRVQNLQPLQQQLPHEMQSAPSRAQHRGGMQPAQERVRSVPLYLRMQQRFEELENQKLNIAKECRHAELLVQAVPAHIVAPRRRKKRVAGGQVKAKAKSGGVRRRRSRQQRHSGEGEGVMEPHKVGKKKSARRPAAAAHSSGNGGTDASTAVAAAA